jgi:dipeptidyl aminopeptidase/acylaminoacyl peptidase
MGGRYDQPDSSVARLIGGPVQKNKEKAAKASPVTYVGKDATPFLIMHGDQDDVCRWRRAWSWLRRCGEPGSR